MLQTRGVTPAYFVMTCLCPGVWLLSCNSLFSPISGDMPKDFSLEVGKPLALSCTVKPAKFSLGKNRTYEASGSKLALKFNGSYVPQDKLIYEGSSVLLRKEEAELNDSGSYYCMLKFPDHAFHVCATQVTVGELPLPVEDFKCISYHYKNLTCSWRNPDSNIRSSYVLSAIFGPIGSHQGSPRECPKAKELRTPSSCTWNLSSTPVYRKEAPRFRFVLTGRNELGSKNWTYSYDHLSILKLSEPRDFKSIAVTKRGVTIRWKAPVERMENPKLEVAYEIGYLSQYEQEWKELHILNKTSVMVQGLEPYTNYTFRLRARASKSAIPEPWTGAIYMVKETLPDVPYGPPKISPCGFKVQNYQSKRSITLNFAAISKKQWSGITLKYLVECCEEMSPEEQCENKTTQVPTATFDDLRQSTAYNFRLWSLNEHGISKNHSNIRVGKHDDLMSAPQDIKVMALSSGEYEVSWRPSTSPSASWFYSNDSSAPSKTEEAGYGSEEAPPQGYTVFWCPRMLPWFYGCDQSLEWRRVPPNVTSTVLELEPGKLYQFAVAAQSKPKTSEMAWTSCVVPVSKELGKINRVSLERDGAHSLRMRWQLECSALKTLVERYQIEVCTVTRKYRNMALRDAAGCMYSKYDINSCKAYNVTNADAEEQLLGGLDTDSVHRAVIRALSNGRLTEDSPAQCASTSNTVCSVLEHYREVE
ncbi:uncharacterized protein LOC8039342 [Ixodes scapularis]|uniref:uncharacterized protein LOC8039342 n=1 Tax=Ixodes scapularis TaxID=6945 RepID=UPI001C38870A|nr:uncharacterized protein LOC8039342 [Ixodes scapularis]